MTKICLMVNKLEEINSTCDAIIIGLKNYNSLNILELDIDDILNISSKSNKEIFVSMNKIIRNSKIDELKNILIKFDNQKISGIIFDDTAIYNLVKDLNTKVNLVWGNIHHATNSNTIDAWNDLFVKSCLISPDITLEEILEIKKNTMSKMFVPIYGMFEIFSSNRFLVKNYLKYIKKDDNDKMHYINHRILNTYYPIYEDNNGTHVINGEILNGLEEVPILYKHNIDYLIINTFMLENFKDIINAFNEVTSMCRKKNIKKDKIKELSNNLGSNSKGFLYKETIYRVKSDVDEKK